MPETPKSFVAKTTWDAAITSLPTQTAVGEGELKLPDKVRSMPWVDYWRDVALPYALDKAREAIAQRDEASQTLSETQEALNAALEALKDVPRAIAAALDVPKPSERK